MGRIRFQQSAYEGEVEAMMKKCIVLLIVVVIAAAGTAVAKKDGALSPIERLGKELFFDKLSSPDWMSCASCHAPNVGFTGPIPGINAHGAVYRGAAPHRFGNRKPPSAAYATTAPIFHFDEGEGLFIGGNFWDGRATGEGLGNPAADQALGPFLNPVEQNNPSKMAVLEQVADSKYADLWEMVWGEPISYGTPEDIDQNYDRIGLSIAAYEASSEVNAFSSKFDLFWSRATMSGMDVTDIDMGNWQTYADKGLSMDELEGLALFNDESKGMCALCHVLDPYVVDMVENPPLFTDYSFDNLGVPKNPENPFYGMDEVYLDNGDPINPMGANWVDLGLGAFLENSGDPGWAAMAEENYGKQKVPTLRNVAKAPGNGFPKAFMHNGVFKSLKEVVHFYNTRDVEVWPPPEVAMNVNTDELGDLGLTNMEEDLIVLFMTTLSDGYRARDGKDATPWSLEIIGPNPFNPSTRISYYLPEAGIVRLHAFNVAGQKVATVIDGWKEAGEHHATFVADDLPSGVYFLRLASGSETRTVKAVLLK
jgi:cytochrome c peroxidase